MKKRLILALVVLAVGTLCLLGALPAMGYQEAPMLRVKVAAGELPPIEERLPAEPLVVVCMAGLCL